jgi:hypothetical protein
MRLILTLLSLTTALASAPAFAQEDLDLDGDDRKSSRRDSKRKVQSEVVREVERGTYVKAGGGTTVYLMNRADLLRGGTTVNLAVGRDFIDKDKFSFAAEFTFHSALHNGESYITQGAAGLGPDRLIQGDIHTFSMLLGAEASAYPIRRFGIGARFGAGVMFVPILMDRSAYDSEVVGLSQNQGAWNGPQNAPGVHNGALPMIYAGPTFEYYTKLSHFSIGLDADIIFPIGLDLGASIALFFKYTF